MPSTTTMRISTTTKEQLRELASRSGQKMEAVLDEAVELYRRQRFLEEANAAFAALRMDPQAWAAEAEERAAWDMTLADGLKD